MTQIGPSTPALDQALLPAAIRNGSKERQAEYAAALSFERSLLSQMTASMMKTAGGTDDDSTSASVKAMKESMPATLTDAIMNAGGLGLAAQLDASWHPGETGLKTSLSDQPASGGASTAGTTTSTPASSGGTSA